MDSVHCCFLYLQVWLILPVIMIVVSLFLVIMPLTSELGPSFLAFVVILSGVPVYIFLVMETPWKLRPTVLDQCSGMLQKSACSVCVQYMNYRKSTI